MIYQPTLPGMTSESSVVVEVIEVDFERGLAVVLAPVGSDSLANVFRVVQRTVPRSSLRPISG